MHGREPRSSTNSLIQNRKLYTRLNYTNKKTNVFRTIDPQGLKPLTVTVATARRISGLGNTTIWALIKARRLETVHVGRRTLVTFRSLEALLDPSLQPEHTQEYDRQNDHSQLE